MKIKIKKVNPEIETIIPKYANDGDAGLDLVATSKSYDDNGNVVYGTNLAIEIPKSYIGLIFPRSSISKYDLSLANAVGVVDSGYRGEIMFKFKTSLRDVVNMPEMLLEKTKGNDIKTNIINSSC